MIIDVHTHIYPAVRGRTSAGSVQDYGYGKVSGGPGETPFQLIPPFRPQTAFEPDVLVAHLDFAGVDRAVLLQGPFYGDVNDYVIAAVRKYPERLTGAFFFDPWEDAARETFDAVPDLSAFGAVKIECVGLCDLHPGAALDDPDLAWLWQTLEERGRVLVFDLGAPGSPSYQTAAVRGIAEHHPSLKIIIAHLAQPKPEIEADPQRMALWDEQIELGQLPNIWFDNAALPGYYPDEAYPFPTAARYLQTAIERIGPEKVMWGTDMPGLLLQATYPQLVSMAHLHTRFLSPAQQELFFWRNAQSVYDLEV